ncbi:hypothetical protein ACIQV3_34685 [Streptomyces sp. NPDC099050]|uniref:hypothetical protein n=1 Tax=Streptomyces sp. NPDC099050 TaxID=3366100 RepID=UPI0037F79280
MATAEKSAPGGRITDVELETEDGTQVREIDVMTAEPRVHHRARAGHRAGHRGGARGRLGAGPGPGGRFTLRLPADSAV